MIPVNDPEFGARFGFTSDRFTDDSYLWRHGNEIMVSLITSTPEGRGHFSALVKRIEAAGYTVAVSTPLRRMTAILQRWGFAPTRRYAAEIGADYEAWVRKEASR
jgi:hypothetical protein